MTDYCFRAEPQFLRPQSFIAIEQFVRSFLTPVKGAGKQHPWLNSGRTLMMKVDYLGRLVAAFELLAFCGCTFNEPRIRSEPLLFFPTSSATPATSVTLGRVPLHCVQTAGWLHRWIWSPFFSSGSSSLDECVYQTVSVAELETVLTKPDQSTGEPVEQSRNNIEQLMMAVSNQNCNNFRAKVFAFRTNAGVVSSTASTLLAGGGAITALVSGPVGAGLAGGSAALQGTLANVNSQFYSDYGAGALDQNISTSIKTKGLCIQRRMNAALSSPTPSASPTAATTDSCPLNRAYTVGDRIADLQAYDASCSLEEAARPTPTPATSPAM